MFRVTVREFGNRTLLACLLCLSAAAPLAAQPAAGRGGGGAAENGSVPVQAATDGVYRAPEPKHEILPVYPPGALAQLEDGWVGLSMMVDTAGKPHDIVVTHSTGSKLFDNAAVQALERWTFEPATQDGKPVEARYPWRYNFYANTHNKGQHSGGAMLANAQHGAGRDFRDAYRTLQQALQAHDRAAADAALKQMQVTNEYEDAFYGLGRFQYALLWGDQRQQLEGLRRAVGPDNAAQDLTYGCVKVQGVCTRQINTVFDHYLDVDVWKSSLITLLDLQIKTQNYGEALETWDRIRKAGVKPEIIAKLSPLMDQVQTLRTDNQSFDVAGVLSENGWALNLFKDHFRLATDGNIDRVNLRCDRGSLSFKLDLQQEYSVHGNYGKCEILLTGTPGTRFTLTQF
jgi:TonB family protein